MRALHSLPPVPAYLITVTIALIAAKLFAWLHIPLPWLTGPLLIIGVLSVMKLPVISLLKMRNLGQWAMGSALGIYFTPDIVRVLGSLWWAVVLAVVFAMVLGLLGAQLLFWCNRGNPGFDSRAQLLSTAYYSSAIGAASEMTILSERSHLRTDLVAASHSLRLMIVTLCVPFIVAVLEGTHAAQVPTAPAQSLQTFQPAGFALFALITASGVAVFHWLKQPNPWFLGPFTASVIVALCELQLSAMPSGMSNAAQLIIGISLGVRFSRQFLKSAPFWALSIAALTGLIAISAGFAWLLWQWTDLDYASLLLATSPGGIIEMSITAKIFALSVPVVTSFQVTRLVAVLLLTEPLHRWLYSGDSNDNNL